MRLLGFALLSLAALLGPSVCQGVPVAHPGDFLIPAFGGKVILYHPESGVHEDFAQLGPEFTTPTAIVREPVGGDFFLCDFNAGAVLRMNAQTGEVSILSRDGDLWQPTDLTWGWDGFLYETDNANIGVRISPQSGEQTRIAPPDYRSGHMGIELGPDGKVYLANPYLGQILRVDPQDGSISVVTDGGLLFNPTDLAFQDDGSLIVSDNHVSIGQLVRVNVATGEQTLLAQIPFRPWRIVPLGGNRALLTCGDAYFGEPAAVVEVDLANGSCTKLVEFSESALSLYVFPLESPVQVRPMTWGAVKHLYR